VERQRGREAQRGRKRGSEQDREVEMDDKDAANKNAANEFSPATSLSLSFQPLTSPACPSRPLLALKRWTDAK
jgi:hypothetical protein